MAETDIETDGPESCFPDFDQSELEVPESRKTELTVPPSSVASMALSEIRFKMEQIAIQGATKENLESVCDYLSAKSGWPGSVELMYVKGNKIHILILQGTKDQLDDYLEKQFSDVFHEANRNILEISELLSPFKFHVAKGNIIQRANEQHFGTVGLIAKEISTRVNYLVTARHVFFPNGEPIQIIYDPIDGYPGDILCNDNIREVFVATKSYGVFGGYGKENKWIDISVIPLETNNGIGNNFDNFDSTKLLSEYNMSLPQQEQQIYEVEAKGAVTHNAQGEIESFNARKNYFGCFFNDCLLIKPRETEDGIPMHFSTDGDSGALVIGKLEGQNYFCGLISMGVSQSLAGYQYTIAAKLRNCFDAIKDRFGWDLKACC